MKSYVIAFGLLGIVLASQAQQLPGAAPQGVQIASPNRTESKAWAAATSGKSSRHKHKGDKDESSGTAAIAWVDSTGKTVGRALGSNAMLVSFENQLAALTGLEADRSCNAANVCTFPSGGNQWSRFYTVYYTSPDCSGTPYLPYGGFGTPYAGVPVIDGDIAYIYIFKVTDTTRLSVNSSYVNNTCHAAGRGGFPSDGAPVTAVVPASTFGTAPYFLK